MNVSEMLRHYCNWQNGDIPRTLEFKKTTKLKHVIVTLCF